MILFNSGVWGGVMVLISFVGAICALLEEAQGCSSALPLVVSILDGCGSAVRLRIPRDSFSIFPGKFENLRATPQWCVLPNKTIDPIKILVRQSTSQAL